MDQQSIVICDYCKQILEAPILLPCEHTICKQHYNTSGDQTACMFCGEKHGQFFTVLKKLENLIGKLRTAKHSYEMARAKINEFEAVKHNPLACINQHFDTLKGSEENR